MSSSAARGPYFVSPIVDFVFIGGGSFVVFAVMLLARLTRHPEATGYLLTTLSVAVFFANNPHFTATNHRLYRTRRSMLQFPVTSFLVPVMLVGVTVAALASPDEVAPYFVKLFNAWSPYHFAAQTLGITLIYCHRAGITVERIERRALSWFLFAICLKTWVISEVGGVNQFFGITYPRLVLPRWTVPLSTAGLLATGAAMAWVAARWWRRGRVPLIVLFPVFTHLVWFTIAPRYLYFREFVNFFHSVQYMLVATAMWLSEERAAQRVAGTTLAIGKALARWLGLHSLYGAIFFFASPRVVAWLTGLDYVFALGVIWTALQVHHFFVDAVIWKLKHSDAGRPAQLHAVLQTAA